MEIQNEGFGEKERTKVKNELHSVYQKIIKNAQTASGLHLKGN